MLPSHWTDLRFSTSELVIWFVCLRIRPSLQHFLIISYLWYARVQTKSSWHSQVNTFQKASFVHIFYQVIWTGILYDSTVLCVEFLYKIMISVNKTFWKILPVSKKKDSTKRSVVLFILCNNIVVSFKFFNAIFWLYVSRY